MPPDYVAIITDGNGRWAAAARRCRRSRATAPAPTWSRRGSRDAVELGIKELTVFSFSTENWSRPTDEVDGLMAMFAERIDRETPELDAEGVRMRFIGRREGDRPRAARADATGRRRRPRATSGSRCSSPSTTAAGRRSSTRPRSFEGGAEEEFRDRLYAPEMHDPDLLIRTSGEQRISNFLLWQCAYSELVFRDELWPDFTREAFEAALAEYEDAPAPLRGAVDDADGLRDRRSSRASTSTRPAGGPRRPRPPPGSRRRAGAASAGAGRADEPAQSAASGPAVGDRASRCPGSRSSVIIAIVGGRAVFAVAMIGLGVLGLREFFRMTERRAAVRGCVAFAAVAGDGRSPPTTASQFQIDDRARRRAFPVDVRRRCCAAGSRAGSRSSIAMTVFGDRLDRAAVRARGAAARPARTTAAALLVDVLVGDVRRPTPPPTPAGACSAAAGSRRAISPNKTLEGLVVGLHRRHAWASGSPGSTRTGSRPRRPADGDVHRGLLAPVGDLFASMIKRDLADQGLGHDLRPARRPARPPRRGPVHDRGRLLPGGRVRLLSGSVAGDRRADELEVGPQAVGLARRLDDHGGAGLGARADHPAQRVDVHLALAEALVAVGARARRVARVVRVQEVDPAGDREHPLDRVGEVLAGGVRVAGVEAEAEVDPVVRAADRVPAAAPARRTAARRRCRRRRCSRAAPSRRSRASRASAPSGPSPRRCRPRRGRRGRSPPWPRARTRRRTSAGGSCATRSGRSSSASRR